MQHLLEGGAKEVRVWGSGETTIQPLREGLQAQMPESTYMLCFLVGDVSNPDYSEESMHDVDYMLYAPAVKSSDECEAQLADACQAILSPVNYVISTAITCRTKKFVVLTAATPQPLVDIKSLITAMLEKVVIAEGRYLGSDAATAIICTRQNCDLSELTDYAFANGANANLLVQSSEEIKRIPCENFEM